MLPILLKIANNLNPYAQLPASVITLANQAAAFYKYLKMYQ